MRIEYKEKFGGHKLAIIWSNVLELEGQRGFASDCNQVRYRRAVLKGVPRIRDPQPQADAMLSPPTGGPRKKQERKNVLGKRHQRQIYITLVDPSATPSTLLWSNRAHLSSQCRNNR